MKNSFFITHRIIQPQVLHSFANHHENKACCWKTA